MAKIPLRAYNREIEGMIDRGQAAQAISHGRHILKFFPKHIDTYRLLGKAFLELQRYSEAADVLERVLACVPDDFISQIGMGIIREDEGNLDAAIWHMERAFEAQPSNVGVQEELRRLHGKRDGVEPAKIRLTRGALVRMYARGELYQQAIAEARAALAEDPQRADIEIILARMYFMSGQKVAATEACTHLLTSLPFCFEANRILAEILPGTTRAEDAKLYMQRVYAMDPYLEHLTHPVVSSSEVPENAVELEHLEWLSEQEAGQPPEWTKSLDAGWTDQAEPVPEWITGAQFESKPVEPPAYVEEPEQPEPELVNEMPVDQENFEQPIVQPGEENEIPEWMKQAGWQPSTGETEEAVAGELPPEEPAPDEEAEPIEQAEIPDWLAAIAPVEKEAEMPEGETEKPDWLADMIKPGSEEDHLVAEGEMTAEASFEPEEFLSEAGSEVPGQEQQVLEEAANEPQQEPVENPPEWVPEEPAQVTEEAPPPEYIPEEIPGQPAVEEPPVPEWLANLQAVKSEPEEVFSEETPTGTEVIHDKQIEPQPAASEEALPDWLRAPEPSGEEPSPVLAESASAEIFEQEESLGDTQPTQIKRGTPAFLNVDVPVEEPSTDVEPELEIPTVPDSTTEVLPEVEPELGTLAGLEPELEIQPELEPELEVPTELEPELEKPTEAEPDQEIPWLEAFDVEKRAEEEAPAGEEELPDWMQEMLAERESSGETAQPEESLEGAAASGDEFTLEKLSTEEPPIEEQAPTAFAGGWLAEEPESPEIVSAETAESELEEEPELSESEASFEEVKEEAPTEAPESGAAFAWLENLAARQGAEEETLLVPPEQRQEEPPEWVKEHPEEGGTPSIEAPQPVGKQAEPFLETQHDEPSEGAPVVAEVEEPPAAVKPEPSEEAIPEWLRGLSAEEEPIQPETTFATASEEAPAAEESLGWLEELTLEEAGISPTQTVEAAPAEPEPAIEAPTPFTEDESILQAEEPAGKDALPDWLQGLDEEKSAEEVLPVLDAERRPSEGELTGEPEVWMPEMAAEAPTDESEKKLEDTSPVRVTPQAQVEISNPDEILQRAEEALEAHNVERALEQYDRLIQSGEYLEDTIHDLRDALYRYPIDAGIWQALGDACMKSNQLQDALDAYSKAEELLR